MGLACILRTEDFKVGDTPPPSNGYLDWHAWADVQYKGGLRQSQCPLCNKWYFPQELSDERENFKTSKTKHGKMQTFYTGYICLKCSENTAKTE